MIINDRIINADCLDIVNELQTQLHLNKIPLINKIVNTTDNVMITCPYHKDGQERKPSAGIRKDDGTFHCFTCGETHSLPEVVSYCFGYKDMFGKQGMKWLTKNFNYTEVENRNVECNITRNRDNTIISDNREYVGEQELDKYRYYHSYWTKRGITDDNIIELFDLGYDKETDCITMPVRDEDGNTLFIARRSVKTKFFTYPKGVQKPLYGLYEYTKVVNRAVDIDIMRGRGSAKSALLNVVKCPIFVTESMIDCLLLWQAGFYAVALNGLGNELQFEQLRELPNRHLILATDNDDAGKQARDRIKRAVTNKVITEIQFPDHIKDVGEMSREQIDTIMLYEVF